MAGSEDLSIAAGIDGPPGAPGIDDPRPAGRTVPAVRRATGMVLALLDAAARSRVRVHGAPHLPAGPVLFVSNHFTRSETFLLPWLLDRVAGRKVSSLAWHGLFRGVFGAYLEAVGARSTREAGIKDRIVRELAEGTCDWLIYPEGEMVKNKRVWGKGRFQLATPDQHGPPHTGAALLALRAVRAARRIGRTEPLVVPVSVTYHPIRPGLNPVLRLAARLAGPLPGNIQEELTVEGRMLFERTDIDVVIGEPVDLRPWDADSAEPGRADLERLTTRFMQAVYGRTVRNIDHLVATALAEMTRDAVTEDDLAKSLFLAVRDTESGEGGIWHGGVGPALLDALSGCPSRALEDILEMAAREGACARAHGVVLRHRDGFCPKPYDEVRLHHTVAVLANEIAPDRVLVRAVGHRLRASSVDLDRDALSALERIDMQEHIREGGAPERGPRWIDAPAPRGVIVLSHGFNASPAEMQPLALHLARQGWTSRLVRLPGHASRPENLDGIHRQDWWRGFQRALSLARLRHPGLPLVVGGFSTGALLALRAASELVHPPRAVLALSPALKIANRASLAAPLLDGWNHLVDAAGLGRLGVAGVPSHSEFPDSNYGRHSIHALHQLELLAAEVRPMLPRIHAPVLVVHADADPVIRPESGDIVFRELGSASRLLLRWSSRRHGIVRGEGAEAVHERIAQWLERTVAPGSVGENRLADPLAEN